MNNIKYYLVVQLLFSYCLCEISDGLTIEVDQEKFLNGFKEYYNSLPNQVYRSEEGSLLSTQQVDDSTYQIVVSIRVAEINNAEATKLLKCTATIKDSDNDVTIINNNCEEAVEQKPNTDENPETTLEAQVEVSEPTVERKPVQLANEVQADTTITSGEQFIAIPRDQPSAPCVGCASHVNPQAPGVSDLANLGVRHLNLHEPSVKHSLDSVIDVERQVQVVNGVRYILTLSINSNYCTVAESENCASTKTCKITILVKPRVKLPNGGNYRAILANNCTEEWQYGDDGEVLPEPSADNNQIKGNTSVDPSDSTAFDGDIQVKHNTNVESQPNQERTLTDEDIKKIQEQIITNTQFQEVTESSKQSFTLSPDATDASKQHVFKVESGNHNENTIPVTESEKTEQASNINLDKKKAIDEMLDYFDFSGFKPKSEAEEVVPRVRRSYDYDLQVLSLAKDYRGIKNSLENARFMYEMAKAMVDYLNEMDIDVKNREVKNVMRAEEETENLQRFVYIQARVTIPCDKVECEPRDVDTQICNGVIDCSNENSPQILNTFCYNDNKESEYRKDIREISLHDPVLRKMAEEAVKIIESDSKSQYAMKIYKIVSAITQKTSGTLTKFSVIVENIKCNKSVPLPLRINCTVLEQLGSKICDVIVLERHWLKEKKISYTCTERPSDMRISKSKKVNKNVTVDDPKIIEMLQEAIQYLESQSDKTNKQKIVNVKSISSQIIAGFLTKIEFVVGYTDCTENYSRDQINKCELLKGEGLRSCRAQIWDRSWILDGRQIEVSCDDASKANEIVNTRKKRSIDSASDQEQRTSSKDNGIDYKALANESLYKFMQSSASHQHYKVVKVDKAIVQDISRKLIKIDFSISPTDCLIQKDGALSSSKCEIVNPKNILHCHSKILENNWIVKKQYFVKCNIKYQQKKNTNVKERNPSDSKYYQLAEESLAKYLHDTGNPHHIIVRVEKVTTQIVSGLLTRIDFIISPKNHSVSNSETVRCHSEILEKNKWLETKAFNVSCQMKKKERLVKINTDDPKYMQIAVESLQKYIKDKPEQNLVRVAFVDKVEQKGDTIKIGFIASHAEEGDGDTFCYAEVSETRESKSDIKVKCHLIGKIYRKAEITEDDPNYYKYVQLADDSLCNYFQKINSAHYTIVSIESVTVQWDGGIKTRINFTIAAIDSENNELMYGKQCIAEILEQPWLHKKNIDVNCELEKDLYRIKRRASNSRVHRQLTLCGVKEQDPSNPEYKTLAEECLRKYVVDSGITQPLQVARIEKVTTEVGFGTLTRIDFLVSGDPDSETIECHSKVWDKPGFNSKEIDMSCQSDSHLRSKRELVGGPKDQDPTKPRYKALAEESLRKYAIDSGITEPLEVMHVEKVTTQIVSGTVIRIDFLVSGSPDSEIIKCHSEVWDRPWLKQKYISITVSCENDGHRGKRQILGGLTEVDPTAPRYKALAEESLQKYITDFAIAQPLQVVHVEKVTTQVVAASMTRIDFIVSSSPDSKTMKCHSEVWEQGWRNLKEIKVSCEDDGHRGKRQIPGGLTEVDPTAPQYKALAEESLQKYMIDFAIAQPLQVVHVEKVTTQVVAGSMTRIDFVVSGSPDSKTMKCHSEVWEQVWRNFKEIKVSCEDDGHRGKRQIPGGLTEVDPTAPQYKALAEESLQKYMIDFAIAQPLQVVHVEKVTTQVVAGSMTRIDFVVSGSPDSKTMKCHSEVWEQVWRNFKEIKVSCENDGHRAKRQITGGLTEVDPTAPRYKALAEESLQKYMTEFAIAQPLQVVHVEKVTTQVVAGSMTRIDFIVSSSPNSKTMKCHSEVWEQGWRNLKEIKVSCEDDGHRGKRQIPGGLTEVDPTAPQYKALAEESLQKYMIDFAIAQPLQVVHVEKVTTQVVAGSMTRIDFVVSGSPDSKTMKCHSEVWEQVWRNFKEIKVSCENDGHRAKRQITGGLTEVDPTAPRYKALAEESLQKYMTEFAIAQPLQVVHVEKVTTQVVAGSMTRIDFIVSSSPDSKTMKCHSEVWEQGWRNLKEIKVSCEDDGHRGKRQIPGGLTEVDPTAPQYKALAEESLQKYMIDFAIAQPLQVVHVEKVTTQVVAGSMTRIDFVVSGSPDSKTMKCHSEVWEQVWRNFKEIKVSCENDGHRAKRQITGGLTEVDPTAPRYKALAEESLQKYMTEFAIAQPLQVVHVEKVTTQVVAGSMTRIDFVVSGSPDSKTMKCHSEVWEQVWRNFKEIKVSCENDGHRGKRQITGGLTEVDPTAPRYKALAEESLQKYMTDFAIAQPLQVVHVEKVTTQVVAGSMTRIDFVVSGSPDSKTMKCHSEVWEQGWRNFKEIKVSCENDGHRGKRQITGGLTEVDPTAPRYKALAEESLQKYITDFAIAQPLQVVHVEKVTTQVVAGSMTRIDFVVSASPDSKTMKCHSEVWEQGWRNFKEIKVSCENDGHRAKRKIDGGIVDQYPNELQYRVLAEESLRKYRIDFGISEPLEVARVERVTTVVSGSLTRIDFLITGHLDSKIIKCHSEVWESGRRSFKEIKVACENDSHRGKRELVGGPKDRDPTEPRYKALAEESLRKYATDSGITEPLEVMHIEKVTTQVVSGTVIRIDFLISGSPDSEIIKCHSEVWDRPWLKRHDITVSCENDGHRGKRQVDGGFIDQDPTEPRYKTLAEDSLRKYLVDSGVTQSLEVASVERVITQVVSQIPETTGIDFTVSGNHDSITIRCHSDVWEQPSLNRKKIEVSCQNYGHKVKRQIAGGLTEVDPTAPQYKALAEESLQKYKIDFAIAQPLQVVHVEKVTTQVVAGSMTRIDFVVSGSPDSKTMKCHSEVWEQVWRNFKEIKVSCENDGHRAKRQITGGLTEVDPTAPRYKALAEESLQKYMTEFAIAQPLQVVHVEKVTTQVVAGSMTRIDFVVSGSPDSKTMKCHSEVWEQVWRNFKEIKVSCENDGHRGKRQITGGLTEVDPTAPRYKALAEESLQKYMTDFAIAQPLQVVHVEKVTTQVVAGSMTRIDFVVSGSPDSKTMKCHSEVWEQGWRNFKEIKVSCENDGHRGKRQITGGLTEVDPTAPRYKALAEESLQKYITDFAIAQPLQVVHVEKVTTQVVAGSMTRIDFVVSASPDSKTMKCHSEVWEQGWRNFKEIKVSCENDGHRAKRKIDGGIVDQYPNELQYRVLAEESLRKYRIDFGISEPLEVARVERVTTVVSGSLTRIDFLITGHLDSKIIKCHSEVWESGRRSFKEIKVACENDSHRGKRELVGGPKDRDPTEPRYKALAEESLRKYATDSGITEPLEVMHIEKVTTQVVSGTVIRIDFLISGSPDSEIIKCHSEVWDRPWLKRHDITVSCENDGHRGKRQVDGGFIDQDPTEPRYKTLAEDSLRKYLVDSGVTQSLEVASVERVITQVVSQIPETTGIDFTVSGNHDSITIRCHSDVWEQPSLNRKKIEVSCQNYGHKVKRQIAGGLTEVDPTAPQYKALAEESLQKYKIDFAIAQPLQVVHVEKVTTQVVAGSMTRIDFVVSGSPDSKTMKCHSEVWEQVWRNFKEIKVSCENDGHRAKRQITGGLTEVDPTAPRYKALAEESLQKYMTEFAIAQPLQVVHVEKVTTQVVAGSMTRIDFVVSASPDSKTMKCHSEVWEQGWRNFKEIKVSCENDGHRGKRQITGGLTEVDPTAPRYKALAEESLQKYMTDFAIAQPLQVVHVEKVTTQVVAGSMTRIDFVVSGSPDSKTMKCHSEVWEQGWRNFKEIKVSCENDGHRGKRQITGGLTEVDPTAPRYKALAEESLQKYMTDFAIAQPLQVVHVEKVTTQVVAGSMTRIDFVVSGSPDSKTMKCHSEVWEQVWQNFKEIKVSCENDGHRAKRKIDGGIVDQYPHELHYRVLAEESLQKYMTDFAIAQPLQVVHVEKVTTQLVAGSMTRIDFVVSGSRDSKTMKCHSEVWEQGWRNFKEIKVSCENDGHRGKRQITGGLTEVDPTAPRYKALAEESLQKYTTDFAISQPLQVVHVEKVTTQVVAGLLTRIDFLVSGSQDSKIFKCHSKVWDRPWLKEKDINVTCLAMNERVKRHLRLPGGASDDNLITSQYKVLTEESFRGNSSTKGHQHVGILRGHDEEEQDPNKSEYKLLAEESLRKLYQKKSTVYHKVIEVHRVVTRVVSGIKYKIDFTAAPTACSVNVSSVRARNCKADDDALMYCHSDIWDQPWLKKKKIVVQCNGPTYDNDNFAEHESDNELSLKPSDPQKNNDDKYIKLAEEASEKYLTTSNRKYVHKVTEILSASEQVADGTLTTIVYSLSPTTCLRNETTNNTSCKLKQPLVVYNCNANIRIRPWLHVEKEITVTCKKNRRINGKKRKRESGLRNIRETGDDNDDEIDEDTIYYYADHAVQHINDKSNSNNLQKLISIHAVQNGVQMGTVTVKMFIEVAETFCLRHLKSTDLRNCDEMSGLKHRLCLARLWPSPDDELIVRHVSVICDDEADFVSITGVSIPELTRLSVVVLENHPENTFKLVHQGEPQVIPSLDSRRPFKLSLIIGITNCSKDVDLSKNPFQCYLNPSIPSRSCRAFIWLKAETKYISNIDASCTPIPLARYKRSALDPENVTLDYSEIQKMVTESLEQLEMQSLHRYKQRVLQINSHSTKVTSGKVTTIDFDVGYTSCLKYEWVANITDCNFLDHLPRRRCVAQIWERLWIKNGRNIDVKCVDDETPLESHIEFESAEMANELAKQALKHIEAKYPNPSKQKVVRIFSLEKQVVAGIHYKMKVEVGVTDCFALSDQKDCKLIKNHGVNKFCRVNVWIRPWTDHPPNFRVSCDFQEGTNRDLYYHVQAEHLFYNFLTTYSPTYVNNYSQMHKRFEIFKKNIKKIHELNIHEKGTAVYGVTRFTDLSYEEFSSTYMGLKTNLTNENQVPMKQADIPDIKVPSSFDWREHDAVTDVKDQGSCGSCWAFSVTGNIEGQWRMQSGQLVSLSEQELVDCDNLDNGCSGGLPDNAYRAIEQMGGLELESDYPYEGADEKCLFNKTLAKVQISGAVNITTNETGMAQWLLHNGPISIGINANAMQFYMGGISHPWKMLCNPKNLDHGVLIVGYGVKDYPVFHKQIPYWIIKNSWGKSWGEQGYYRVYRGDGTCGVNQMASSAVI